MLWNLDGRNALVTTCANVLSIISCNSLNWCEHQFFTCPMAILSEWFGKYRRIRAVNKKNMFCDHNLHNLHCFQWSILVGVSCSLWNYLKEEMYCFSCTLAFNGMLLKCWCIPIVQAQASTQVRTMMLEHKLAYYHDTLKTTTRQICNSQHTQYTASIYVDDFANEQSARTFVFGASNVCSVQPPCEVCSDQSSRYSHENT